MMVLNPEFQAKDLSPCFLECFQEDEQFPEALQLRLIHLFGAVLSGAKASFLLLFTLLICGSSAFLGAGQE